MALSRFMPYGAPELLADQDERLAKAGLTSMALLGALLAAAGTIASLLPHERIVRAPFDQTHWLGAPPLQTPPIPRVEIAKPAVPPAHVDPHALPKPVPDKQELIEPPVTTTPVQAGNGPATTNHGALQVTPETGVGDGALPEPGIFVYTDELPELIRCAPIVYPELAREANVEGRVVVLVLVGKDGHVLDARVDPKRNVPMLNAAALESARTCVFKPALANDHPVVVWVSRTYDFRPH
jgi:TonB family protein